VRLDNVPPRVGPTEPSMGEVHDAAGSSVRLRVLPSGSLNHATLAPLGDVQTPCLS
jgi:hypothetical protein